MEHILEARKNPELASSSSYNKEKFAAEDETKKERKARLARELAEDKRLESSWDAQ